MKLQNVPMEAAFPDGVYGSLPHLHLTQPCWLHYSIIFAAIWLTPKQIESTQICSPEGVANRESAKKT